MSENNDKSAPFDPTAMFKELRDASIENWTKAMSAMVHSDAYAGASAESLNAMLTAATPIRKAVENAVVQSLSSVHIATRDDVLRIAERLTHIEMRLDDMEAKLDEALRRNAN
jgi:hypothetical protein